MVIKVVLRIHTHKFFKKSKTVFWYIITILKKKIQKQITGHKKPPPVHSWFFFHENRRFLINGFCKTQDRPFFCFYFFSKNRNRWFSDSEMIQKPKPTVLYMKPNKMLEIGHQNILVIYTDSKV